ncbi:MAG TPA: hypothetical protein VN688_08965 [Gemmataceae bacterium]|nr:hypothetical protein [Gemmataceae bacterium]
MPSQCRDGWLLAVLVLVSVPSLYAQTTRSNAGRKKPAATSKANADTPVIQVTHHEDVDGWRVAETSHFRLFHQHLRPLAEAVLRTAERTRGAQQRKWFGVAGANWDTKCRICLYPSGEAYSQATGAPGNTAGGHTDIQLDAGRVLSRTIHLHGDRDDLLLGVLPHEVTHAILAGHFGGERVPRWADEGMAILAETPSRIEMHLRYLPRWRADELLFRMGDLIRMRDYPEPRAIGAFYAQSVSLVDFLTHEKGAERFAAFVRDGERDSYTASLRRHYGWSFAELDRRWKTYAFHSEKPADITTTGGGG